METFYFRVKPAYASACEILIFTDTWVDAGYPPNFDCMKKIDCVAVLSTNKYSTPI